MRSSDRMAARLSAIFGRLSCDMSWSSVWDVWDIPNIPYIGRLTAAVVGSQGSQVPEARLLADSLAATSTATTNKGYGRLQIYIIQIQIQFRTTHPSEAPPGPFEDLRRLFS